MSLAYSLDGKILATGSQDSCIRLWNIESGERVKTLEGHRAPIWSLMYSPDGKTLVSGSADSTIRVWNAISGECLLVLNNSLCDGLDITGVVGLSAVQRTALMLMGAAEHSEKS